MKGKALRKHNLHGKITASVLLKHFISGDERYHNVNPQNQLRTNCSACLIIKTVLSSGYILILLSIEYILASLIELCQG